MQHLFRKENTYRAAFKEYSSFSRCSVDYQFRLISDESVCSCYFCCSKDGHLLNLGTDIFFVDMVLRYQPVTVIGLVTSFPV